MRYGWAVLVGGYFLAALGSAPPAGAAPGALALAPLESFPQAVREAPGEVQEAYRFAVANPELLQVIPCYCGCAALGHRSNYDCYVEQVRPDGSFIISDHGLE